MKPQIEDGGLRIATFYSRSSILDLTPPSFHHSTFHHGLVIPLT